MRSKIIDWTVNLLFLGCLIGGYCYYDCFEQMTIQSGRLEMTRGLLDAFNDIPESDRQQLIPETVTQLAQTYDLVKKSHTVAAVTALAGIAGMLLWICRQWLIAAPGERLTAYLRRTCRPRPLFWGGLLLAAGWAALVNYHVWSIRLQTNCLAADNYCQLLDGETVDKVINLLRHTARLTSVCYYDMVLALFLSGSIILWYGRTGRGVAAIPPAPAKKMGDYALGVSATGFILGVVWLYRQSRELWRMSDAMTAVQASLTGFDRLPAAAQAGRLTDAVALLDQLTPLTRPLQFLPLFAVLTGVLLVLWGLGQTVCPGGVCRKLVWPVLADFTAGRRGYEYLFIFLGLLQLPIAGGAIWMERSLTELKTVPVFSRDIFDLGLNLLWVNFTYLELSCLIAFLGFTGAGLIILGAKRKGAPPEK